MALNKLCIYICAICLGHYTSEMKVLRTREMRDGRKKASEASCQGVKKKERMQGKRQGLQRGDRKITKALKGKNKYW